MVNIIVLATNNQNKVREFKELLKDFPVEIKCLKDYGPLPGVVEDGATFDDNAYKKSSHYARVLGLPCLADDSGLVVDALDGAPGVYSARWAGENATDWDNCEKLLKEMEGKKDRSARFMCVLSLATPGGPALTWEASCEGEITTERRGESGFGYDPVFFYPPLGKTFAEIPMEEKNKVSHRGKAMAEFAAEFDKVLVWLKQRLMEQKPPKPDHSEWEKEE
ncbi:non-canonical purine NTP pyrophosphatase [Desulfolithobacter dissulfuricans]|uniref:dITP/XTP pyrophosphatase n=1 Tax=Desulfolithobacter dissulfuricans TaxID=2795293 RepID=A0A915XLX9_9BACT|nr:XTP/dITP diphosphatase [Desulfolithobacter dissulfuricans]BCO10706.1 non-canonical purine NTP pyrophosphatase [Desulfolithobacter dissulfuricans]